MAYAYLNTTFYANIPSGRTGIRVGSPCPGLDVWLDSLGAAAWAYVTAYNPGSVALSVEENLRRHKSLIAELKAAGQAFCLGEGVGSVGDWPPEPSVLIAGIERADAAALGRRYGQNAIVVGERGKPAVLLWLDTPS